MKKLSNSLLHSLNLTEAQASVYAAALELGVANMQQLATKSGIKRTSIYNFIEEMKERGFIVEITKRKRTMYSAVAPEQLVEIEKTRLAELEHALPELRAIQNESMTKPRVAFYDGIEGIKEVYADILKDKKEIVAFEDLENMKKVLPDSFYRWFPTERARRNITIKSILRDSPEARKITELDIRLLRKTKLINSSDWKTEINIYGDKVALMSYRTKIPFCVLIEDHNIAETLRSAWKELWERL